MKCEKCNKEIRNSGALTIHQKTCEKVQAIKDDLIKNYLDGVSIKKLRDIYNIGGDTINEILKVNNVPKRSISEANKLAHKLYPESFKHSDESKMKMRKKRLEFMKNNPEKTAWRKTTISYPEKCFLNKLKDGDYDKNYTIIREKSIFPYFIDFAFENEKIAVEIDGSQHLLKERKERDDKKDKLLIENGWFVIRFTAKMINEEIDKCFNLLDDLLLKKPKSPSVVKYGIYKNKERKYTCKCGGDMSRGAKLCAKCSDIKQQKVNRPPYEQLIKEIEDTSYCAVGRKYGVSDTAIRKWIKKYKNNK